MHTFASESFKRIVESHRVSLDQFETAALQLAEHAAAEAEKPPATAAEQKQLETKLKKLRQDVEKLKNDRLDAKTTIDGIEAAMYAISVAPDAIDYQTSPARATLKCTFPFFVRHIEASAEAASTDLKETLRTTLPGLQVLTSNQKKIRVLLKGRFMHRPATPSSLKHFPQKKIQSAADQEFVLYDVAAEYDGVLLFYGSSSDPERLFQEAMHTAEKKQPLTDAPPTQIHPADPIEERLKAVTN